METRLQNELKTGLPHTNIKKTRFIDTEAVYFTPKSTIHVNKGHGSTKRKCSILNRFIIRDALMSYCFQFKAHYEQRESMFLV